MATIDQIIALTKQLLPTGRAFHIPVGGYLERLIKGLAASEARAYDDAVSILNSALPDNSYFTAQDATDWSKRLGLVNSPLAALADRKDAIKRKMAHPGTQKARQNFHYIEGQLQAAGFDVWVYENRFVDYTLGYVTKTPTQFSTFPYPHVANQYGPLQYGQTNYGYTYANMIVNSIDQRIDDTFIIGPTFRSTFFIGGPTPGSWAVVDANRKDEFRQLVLKLKPVQMVGYLLINFY